MRQGPSDHEGLLEKTRTKPKSNSSATSCARATSRSWTNTAYFSIVDRIKDLIICSGYNVYPRRIEEAIYEHPAVEEVTVIGIPDAYRGEAPKAFIKLKTGMTATAADILKHLEPKISKIEMPAEIEFRDSLAENDDRQTVEEGTRRRRGQTRQAGMSGKTRRVGSRHHIGRRSSAGTRNDLFDFVVGQGIWHHDAHDPVL